MQVGKPTEKELELIKAIDAKMEPIQSELNALNAEMKEALDVVNGIKNKIRAAKPKLVPLAELKAGVANINSRNKYFPEFLGRFDDVEKKTAFINFVEEKLK